MTANVDLFPGWKITLVWLTDDPDDSDGAFFS